MLFFISAILETLRLFFVLVCPLILRKLIAFLEGPESESSIYQGIQLCLSLVLAGFIGSLCETHSYFQLNKAGILMKTALISAVYKKSLKIIQPNGEFKSISLSLLNSKARCRLIKIIPWCIYDYKLHLCFELTLFGGWLPPGSVDD